MMRRHRTIFACLILTLSSAVHAFAQSTPEPQRIAPTSLSGARSFVPRALGFGDNGESGTYTYDGAGNITAIGSDTFLYDAEGRLVNAFIRGAQATYTYDAFGNRKTATGETNCLGQSVCATPLTVDTHTNHLLTTTNSGATTNVGYGPGGHIISVSGGVYNYDGTGMMTQATVGSDDRQFVYTADDERIAVRQGASWTWTVRGVDNKVLREFTSVEPNNSPGLPVVNRQWVKDYVWRDGRLLASTDATGTYHFHLDHLGTPRLITNMSRIKIAQHAYYPFGAEISLTPHESIEDVLKFTGHERDIVAGDGHTLDDMHARYYNPSLGRFLSIDPTPGRLHRPQSSNRYSYTENNPINLLDPDGRAVALTIYPPGAFDQTFFSFSADEGGGDPQTYTGTGAPPDPMAAWNKINDEATNLTPSFTIDTGVSTPIPITSKAYPGGYAGGVAFGVQFSSGGIFAYAGVGYVSSPGWSIVVSPYASSRGDSDNAQANIPGAGPLVVSVSRPARNSLDMSGATAAAGIGTKGVSLTRNHTIFEAHPIQAFWEYYVHLDNYFRNFYGMSAAHP